MDKWLRSAIDYIGSWIEFQHTTIHQPGVMVAFVHRGEVVAEHAFGLANLDTGEKLTPRHRFRIASHSKSFTSAGIMKLREHASSGSTTLLANISAACIRALPKRPSRSCSRTAPG